MDTPMKILGILIGLLLIGGGLAFLMRGKWIIQAIQKQKFGKISDPRKPELTVAKIIGILLVLIGIYYAGIAIVSLIP
jgi:uncharacterized membrane protein YidH (DUF202 family)